MTVYTNDAAQSGQSNGTATTTGNSGGGTNTAFAQVDGTVTFDNAHPWDSTQDYHLAAGTGVAVDVILGPGSVGTAIAVRYYAYLTGTIAPSATQQWCQFGTSGTNYLGVNTSSHPLVVLNGSTVYTSSYTLLANTTYRVEIYYIVGASSTFQYALYIGDSLTSVDSYTSATANTSGASGRKAYIGKHSSTGNWTDHYVSMIALDGAATGFIGPASATHYTATVSDAIGIADTGAHQSLAIAATIADGVSVADNPLSVVTVAPPIPTPVTPTSQMLTALRTSHAIITTATHKNPFTGIETDLPVEAGSEVVVDGTAAIRRTLRLNLPPLQSLYDALTVPGGEITVTQDIRFVDGTSKTVPIGVFRVDQEQLTYAPGGQLQLTCPDRWLVVQRNRFGPNNRASVASNPAWREIQRLVEGAWPNIAFPFFGWSLLDKSATTKVGAQLWQDGDRESAVQKICAANSLDMAFDANGLAALRPVPILTNATPATWTVDATEQGVMIDADRGRDFTVTRNAVIVSSSATDVHMAPVEVKNAHDPSVDPLSTLGPLGYVPFEFTSSLIRTTAQATSAGKTILQKQLGINGQITLTAAPNPALDVWDVIDVVFPAGDAGVRPVEHHMIQSVTIPLTTEGVQQIGTRQTRTSADDTV